MSKKPKQEKLKCNFSFETVGTTQDEDMVLGPELFYALKELENVMVRHGLKLTSIGADPYPPYFFKFVKSGEVPS